MLPTEPTVLYCAAHGGFANEAVPLGGGAAVCEHLLAEWERTRPFPVRLLSPALLGPAAPNARDLVAFGERRYAAFCRDDIERSRAEIAARNIDPFFTGG